MKLPTYHISIILILLLTGCMAQSQQMYFGIGGAINTSYLRNSKYSFFKNEQRRIWLYYPGGEASIGVGVIPMKTKVSPLFEFNTTYLYRKFGQRFAGYVESGNPPIDVSYQITGIKQSHDIAFAFLLGVKYQGFRFSTGPVIEKFLKGSIAIKSERKNSATFYDGYKIGPAYHDYQRLRHYWQFKFSYNYLLKREFQMSPFMAYSVGFETANNIDTGDWGSFLGYLNSLNVGLRIEYVLTFKKRNYEK